MLQPTPSEWIYSFYCPSLSVASIRVVRTNYNCSIPVTQQFSDKLKINPGRNKSATFRRQSLYLDNCFWFKFSIKTFRFDDLINVIFRIVDVIILTASQKGQGSKNGVQHQEWKVYGYYKSYPME